MFNLLREASAHEIEQICRLLNQRLGFNYTIQKKYLIQSRLNKRLTELSLNSYQPYLDLLERDQAEFNKFVALLTTNVTGFFRESYQFQVLEQELLQGLLSRSGKDKKIRCWSAGCSSGEEAYTLAIVLNEALGEDWDLRILASDISIVKLQEGMAGIYPAERIKNVPKHLRIKYFKPLASNSDSFQVIPKLREQIHFQKINLVEKPNIPGHIRFDLILCRNVFIYLTRESREKALQNFYNYLKGGGYLFLGHSESLDFSDHRWVSFKKSIYQKK